MSQSHTLYYRNKRWFIPEAGYNILIKDLMVDPDEIVRQAIDLYISSGVEFSQVHVYVSVTDIGNHIINLMVIE